LTPVKDAGAHRPTLGVPMNSTLPRPSLPAAALFDTASQLRAAGLAGSPPRPLRGKNVALLTPSPDTPAALTLVRATEALGARVVIVQLGSLPPADTPAFPETLALLGRLYDGLLTDGVPPGIVRELNDRVDRPLLDGALDAARALAPDEADIDTLLQALVMQALA